MGSAMLKMVPKKTPQDAIPFEFVFRHYFDLPDSAADYTKQ